jgi:hypothetical protein
MKYSRLSALAIMIAAGIAASLVTLRAHGPLESFQESEPMPFSVEGKIHRLGPGKITLSTGENMLFHVVFDDKTEVRRQDGSAGSPKDLRVGLSIHVDGDLTESGQIVAHRIKIQASEEKKP